MVIRSAVTDVAYNTLCVRKYTFLLNVINIAYVSNGCFVWFHNINCSFILVVVTIFSRAKVLWLFYNLRLKLYAAALIRACTSLSGTRSDMHFASEVWRTWYRADGEWEVLGEKTRVIICGKVWMVAETFLDGTRLSSACAVKRYVTQGLIVLLCLKWK